MVYPLGSDRHRDPSSLWPLSAIAALLLHGVVGLWVLQARTQNSTSEPAVVTVVPRPVSQQPTRQVAPLPQVDPSPSAIPSDSDPLTETAPSVEAQQPEVAPAPVPVSPSAIATVAPQAIVEDRMPSDRPTGPDPRAPSSSPAPAIAPSPPAAPTTGPGLQTWWTLRPLPAGRDLPDQLPELSARWTTVYLSFEQEPCLASQDWAALGSVTVGLNLTVEADGRISQIRLLQSSGDPAYDTAMICAVERLNPILEPALTRGEPIASDVLLEVTGSPRQ